MLILKQITKDYKVGSGTVNALRGIDLSFRKMSLLPYWAPPAAENHPAQYHRGLDRYTQGDLSINGKSTRDFKDGTGTATATIL